MLAVEIPALKSSSAPLFSLFFPQFLRSSTQITWGALFRHEVLSHDPLLLAVVPKYLRASMTNLVKVCGNHSWLWEGAWWMWPVDHRGRNSIFVVSWPDMISRLLSTVVSCSLPPGFISLKLVLAVMGDFSFFMTFSTLFPGGLSFQSRQPQLWILPFWFWQWWGLQCLLQL